ncbi:MAG: ABC transporter permease [Actinomycetota bacterium]|nr:ABC transporter permease [Actinomycetota bacterium]
MTAWLFRRHGDAVARYGVLVAILVVVIVLGEALAPATLAPSNLATMTTFGVPLGLMAFGEALVILGGGGAIDLSIGGLYPLAPVIAALLMGHHVAEWLAVVAALGVGVAGGIVNGLIVVGLGIPAIIVTLGTLYGYSGLAEVIANGVNLTSFPASFGEIGQGTVGGIPDQLLFIYLPITVVVWYIASRSLYAYRIRLTGTNPVAAYLSGVNVRSTRFKAYVISGLLAALAGLVESSLIMTASPTAGGVFTVFVVVTIVVLGGVDLFGGEGTVLGIVLATAVLMVLGYSFDLANANSILETGLTGVLLIVAMLGRLGLVRFRTRLRMST